VLIGYGASLLGVAFGLVFRKERDLFAQTILGAGLAGLYFTTYAAFFLEGVAIFSNRTLAVPVLLGCLIGLAAVAHQRRSQTVAGVWLFLAYYTVALSCTAGGAAENIFYALGTCTLLAVVALVFHAAHRWLLFTWVAMIATHVSYFYFFLTKPAGLDMTDREYFWVSNGFLALCWVVFSTASILDARKTGEYRRTVAPMAGVNSAVFLCLAWIAIRQHYVEYEWMFRASFTVALLLFAVLAETTGSRRNYLFQVFIAKTVIMFTLTLQAYLSGEKLLVAMALECLALAFSYKRSAVVAFKVLAMGLLAITFVGCLISVKNVDPLVIGPFTVPANWFCGVGAPLVFLVIAWFYEHFIRRVKPEQRIVSGQWFLADTALDMHGATVALLHAAAAALILLTVTIIDQGDHPALPYILGGEGVALALIGFLLRTPQIEVASVLLVLAAHVCYHAFLQFGLTGFEDQYAYMVYTVLLALFTFVGAHFWERYLRRVPGGKPWEHDVVAVLPYLAATLMLTRLMGRGLDSVDAALGQNGLGAVLLLAGGLMGLKGMAASGVMAFAVGTATLYGGLYSFAAPMAQHPRFLPFFLLALTTYAAGERLLAHRHGPAPVATQADGALRSVFVGVGVFIGMVGLSEWQHGAAGSTGRYAWFPDALAEAPGLTLYWLLFAVATMAVGALFRESRYRWAALIVFAVAIVRAFAFDLLRLSPVYQFVSFAGLAAALLVVSWAYSQRRRKNLEMRDASSPDNPPAGG